AGARLGVAGGIGAVAADDRVRARAAGKCVVARAAVELVVAAPATQDVVAGVAEQGVVAVVSGQLVVRAAPDKGLDVVAHVVGLAALAVVGAAVERQAHGRDARGVVGGVATRSAPER